MKNIEVILSQLLRLKIATNLGSGGANHRSIQLLNQGIGFSHFCNTESPAGTEGDSLLAN